MRLSVPILGLCLLAGCASQVTDEQAVTLQPDQGLAAVVLDAPDHIRQIAFEARDAGGHDFEVPDTPGGATLYLTPVKAGRYCVKHMRYGRIMFRSKGDIGCFTVVAGHITYGGDLLPMLPSGNPNDIGEGYVARFYEEAQFEQLLKSGFAKLAAAYPRALPAPPPAGVDAPDHDYAMSTWVKVDEAKGEHTIYVQNNTAWDMTLEDLYLEGCVNVKPACGHLKQDLRLAPFETKPVVVISAADPSEGFQYRYTPDKFDESH